jgi:hypothetical protein
MGLLFEDEGREVAILGGGVEGGTAFLDPGEVAMTEDLSIGIVVFQTTEQSFQRVLLGRGAGVAGAALFVEAPFVADADGMGVVAASVGSYHLLGTATMQLAILRDLVVVATTLETACLVTGFQILHGEVLGGLRCRTMNDNQINATHLVN